VNRTLAHIRANVIAYLALFVALGAGGAWAADKITSKDIAKNAVRSKHIKDGQVKAKDADLTKSRFASNLRAGNSEVLSELNLSVPVKRGDVVAVQGFASARDLDGPGGGGDTCFLYLDVDAPGFVTQASERVLGFDSTSFTRRYFSGTALGTSDFIAGSAIDYLVPANGRFRLEPAFAGGPLADCEIRDRGLAITVQR
jgi:CxxC motif-containing protein